MSLLDHEHPVFVYGSLKRGQPNHRLLMDAEFLGHGRTEPLFALYCLGPYPAMVRESTGPIAVEGELYRISAGLLAELDQFEARGDLYERQLLPIDGPGGGQSQRAWAYLYLRPLASARRWPTASWTVQ
ncbi:MAG TPA: gamma-glutamylcyclotransferase family protein [Pirellulales bacterium]